MEENMLDDVKEVPWNVGRPQTRDEDILVDMPGTDEGVVGIPGQNP